MTPDAIVSPCLEMDDNERSLVLRLNVTKHLGMTVFSEVPSVNPISDLETLGGATEETREPVHAQHLNECGFHWFGISPSIHSPLSIRPHSPSSNGG